MADVQPRQSTSRIGRSLRRAADRHSAEWWPPFWCSIVWNIWGQP